MSCGDAGCGGRVKARRGGGGKDVAGKKHQVQGGDTLREVLVNRSIGKTHSPLRTTALLELRWAQPSRARARRRGGGGAGGATRAIVWIWIADVPDHAKQAVATAALAVAMGRAKVPCVEAELAGAAEAAQRQATLRSVAEAVGAGAARAPRGAAAAAAAPIVAAAAAAVLVGAAARTAARGAARARARARALPAARRRHRGAPPRRRKSTASRGTHAPCLYRAWLHARMSATCASFLRRCVCVCGGGGGAADGHVASRPPTSLSASLPTTRTHPPIPFRWAT